MIIPDRKFIVRAHAAMLAVFLSLPTLRAQDHRFEAGIAVGPSLNTIRESRKTRPGYSLLSGAMTGAVFQYNLSRVFSLHTDITYERKGGQVFIQYGLATPYPRDVIFRKKFDYLTVPVMLRAGFGKGRVRAFADAGLYVSYLLRAQEQEQDRILKTDETTLLTYINQNDFGMAGGLGASVRLRRDIAFSFEVREHLGLLDISTLEKGSNNYRLWNNSLCFLVGVVYQYGRPPHRARAQQKQ